MVNAVNSSANGATYTLYAQTDMTNPDFTAFMHGVNNYSLSYNVNIDGIVYPDVLEIDAQVGSMRESILFAGSGFQVLFRWFAAVNYRRHDRRRDNSRLGRVGLDAHEFHNRPRCVRFGSISGIGERIPQLLGGE